MKNLFLAIDVQHDFMDDGALGVPGAKADVKRMMDFIRNNHDKISDIAVSVDTHMPHQIFHPCWWSDKNGNFPQPYTTITRDDIDNGKYKALYHEKESYDYVDNLEKLGKKTLTIWPYHCLQGTKGAAIEDELADLIFEHSINNNTEVMHIIKGLDPLSEMYGIIKPEYSKKESTNTQFLEKLLDYDKIIIAGEAKSHCVLESVKQILEHYGDNQSMTRKIYVLNDCMSSIPGFEEATEEAFKNFVSDYHINIINSSDIL